MVQRGALLAGSTPWQSTRSLPSRASGRPGRGLASGSDPAAAPQHRCVGRFGLFSSRVLRHPRVPGGSYSGSLGMGAVRRDIARSTGVVPPLAPLLAGRLWQSCACRLQRCVSRERLHDRRSADDRRRFSQGGHLGVLPVCGLVREPRLPDLPASDGDAAAEAGTPACLRRGSDSHRSGRGLAGNPRRAGGRGCGPALGVGLAGHHRLQRTAIRISAFDRGEHVLRRDGVENDRLPPGREPERLPAAHDAGRCTR